MSEQPHVTPGGDKLIRLIQALLWVHATCPAMFTLTMLLSMPAVYFEHAYDERHRSKLWVEAELLAGDSVKRSGKHGAEYFEAHEAARRAVRRSPLGKALEQAEDRARASRLRAYERYVEFCLSAVWMAVGAGLLLAAYYHGGRWILALWQPPGGRAGAAAGAELDPLEAVPPEQIEHVGRRLPDGLGDGP
jgi:hypothetical protein